MPKKQFLRDSKKKPSKRTPQTPETADEYLAGVDFEEAGEKWRGGDAAKSARFFMRALDLYEEALQQFPTSFDLAYNKSRVQFELTQHPQLLALLPGTLVDLLRTALDSSRAALTLRQDNTDVLFNTAQVLTSLVEALSEFRNSSKDDSLRLLEESLELFQRCLTIQEYNYAESQTQEENYPKEPPDTDMSGSEDGGVSIADTESSAVRDDRWATIVEPLTNDTLLDTVLAQLESLTTLCSLITGDESRGLAWIEEYSDGLLNQKLVAYVKDTDRTEEAALTRANFVASLADANYRSHRIDAATYLRALEDSYGSLDLSQDAEGLCHKADALLSYTASLRMLNEASDEVSTAQWKALTAALESLTSASKVESADNVARIHIARGDTEIFRFQLGQTQAPYAPAAKNAATLLKNAATYYRGAIANASLSKVDKEFKEATIKSAVAACLSGDKSQLQELVKTELEAYQQVLEDCVDDGLISIDWLAKQGVLT